MLKRFSPVFALLLIFHFAVSGQVIASFENFNLKPGQHLNNASPDHGFKSGSIELPNFYDAQFDYWSGWAISADTNKTTPGFLNQYSAIAGRGAVGTTTYATGYVYDPSIVRLQPNAIGKPMIGFYVTNTTYAYLSMRDGDAFAKKFGGETGKDPDFFLMTIKKYSGGALADDSINVYLADYRAQDSHKDFILSDWKYVDLTTLGEVDSLYLRMTSSDVGVFGMNTPAYICIDQVSTDNLLSASYINDTGNKIDITPNPAHETLYLDLPTKGTVAIMNMQGVVNWSSFLEPGQHQVSVASWPRGVYFLSLNGKFATRVSIE
jgi:hypothetical protein